MLAFSFGDHRDTERLDVRSVSDHRGVSVDRREERKRRRKASAVSGIIIISTGVAINNITVFMT